MLPLKKIFRILTTPSRLKFYSEKLWRILRSRNVAYFPHTLRLLLGNTSHVGLDYTRWIQLFDSPPTKNAAAINDYLQQLPYQPLISIVVTAPKDATKYVEPTIHSVLKQNYKHWELYVVHQNLNCTDDERIKVINNSGDEVQIVNNILQHIAGEFVIFVDCNDSLSETALLCVVAELNKHPDADIIYSDEDKINARGERLLPHFKTDWNPVMLRSLNYIGKACIYRSAIIQQIAGFDKKAETAKNYDLLLRCIEKTSAKKIRHIPHVLYHEHYQDAQSDAKTAKKQDTATALLSHFKRTGVAVELKPNPHQEDYWRVRFTTPETPKVCIIIPTRDKVELLQSVVYSILDPDKTAYPNLEIVIVDNQSQEDATLAFFEKIVKEPHVTLLRFDEPFNWARINNFAVSQISADLVCLLNNDVKPINKDWLTEMVSYMSMPDVAVVGAKLYFPDDRIQHAGVVLGLGGVAGHIMYWQQRQKPGYMSRLIVPQNYSAVTGACLLVRKNIYQTLGGCDEKLAVAYNDVDFCIRVANAGHQIVWTPFAELYHIESASRGSDLDAKKIDRYRSEIAYLEKKQGAVFSSDPFFNPNLTLDSNDFNLAFPPRISKPWQEKKPVV